MENIYQQDDDLSKESCFLNLLCPVIVQEDERCRDPKDLKGGIFEE
jgi:hypothetical protein